MKQILKTRPIILFSLCFIWLAGCQLFQAAFDFRDPKVELDSVEVKSLNLSKTSLLLKLKIENKNSFDLSAKTQKFTVWANDQLVGEGRFDTKIKAEATGIAEMPVEMNITKLISIVGGVFSKKKEILIKIEGEVLFDTPLGKITRKIERTKTIKDLSI